MIDRDFVLPIDCLFVGAEAARVALPALFTPEPIWRNPEETRTYQHNMHTVLTSYGVWRDGQPTERFLRTLTVLCRASHEVSATVESNDSHYRLHVAASGRDAILACYVPASQQVLLRPARADALAEDLVAELPDVRPAAGPALSIPEADLRDALTGTAARRDVRRVLDVARLPRLGAGQLYAGYRDGLGAYRTTGDSCCTYYDTEYGRYLFSFTEEPGSERYVNVAPGRHDTMIDKTYALLNELRHAR